MEFGIDKKELTSTLAISYTTCIEHRERPLGTWRCCDVDFDSTLQQRLRVDVGPPLAKHWVDVSCLLGNTRFAEPGGWLID